MNVAPVLQHLVSLIARLEEDLERERATQIAQITELRNRTKVEERLWEETKDLWEAVEDLSKPLADEEDRAEVLHRLKIKWGRVK